MVPPRLAVLEARRTTRDADLLAMRLNRDIETVLELVGQIALVAVDDGVIFDAAWRARQEVDAKEYPMTFAEVVDRVVAFADLPLADVAQNRTWSAVDAAWR